MAWSKRATRDIADLTSNGFEVFSEDFQAVDNLKHFLVRLKGPKDTPYEDAIYHIRFTLSDNFPFSSPSVGFREKIQHPNVDLESGSICLDSLNSKWSPVFTLRHIVEVLLPQLMTQPNPDDPLNRDAAALLKAHPNQQMTRAKDYTAKYSFKNK